MIIVLPFFEDCSRNLGQQTDKPDKLNLPLHQPRLARLAEQRIGRVGTPAFRTHTREVNRQRRATRGAQLQVGVICGLAMRADFGPLTLPRATSMLQSFVMSTQAAPPALTRAEIMARVRDRLLAARDDVLGIVLFGSFARGEQHWRDVDVLVVVETLPKSPHDYNRQAAALSRAVGWPPTVDLLLYSHRDFGLNLADHTPLFLDIAFDGQVLYDKRDIAQKLETTRAEVTARGIQRSPTGGWRFPVRYRAATAL
jgi:predicted nucleotidyltransferase